MPQELLPPLQSLMRSEQFLWAIALSAVGVTFTARGLARLCFIKDAKTFRLLHALLTFAGFTALAIYIIAYKKPLNIATVLPWNYHIKPPSEPLNATDSISRALAYGIPVCLILADRLVGMIGNRGSSARVTGRRRPISRNETATAPGICLSHLICVFWFGAEAILILLLFSDSIYGFTSPLCDIRYAGFFTCSALSAIAAGFSHYEFKKNALITRNTNANTPSARDLPPPAAVMACMYAVVAFLDNLAITVLLFPLLPMLVLSYFTSNAIGENVFGTVDGDVVGGRDAQRLTELGSQIADLLGRLENLRAQDDAARQNPEMWVLPTDGSVLTKMFNDGRLIIPGSERPPDNHGDSGEPEINGGQEGSGEP